MKFLKKIRDRKSETEKKTIDRALLMKMGTG